MSCLVFNNTRRLRLYIYLYFYKYTVQTQFLYKVHVVVHESRMKWEKRKKGGGEEEEGGEGRVGRVRISITKRRRGQRGRQGGPKRARRERHFRHQCWLACFLLCSLGKTVIRSNTASCRPCDQRGRMGSRWRVMELVEWRECSSWRDSGPWCTVRCWRRLRRCRICCYRGTHRQTWRWRPCCRRFRQYQCK